MSLKLAQMLFTPKEVRNNHHMSIRFLESTVDTELKADAFFTSMLYAYNKMGGSKGNSGVQVVVGDMPMIIQREMAARKLKVTQAQDLFKKTLQIWESQSNDDGSYSQTGPGLTYDPLVHS